MMEQGKTSCKRHLLVISRSWPAAADSGASVYPFAVVEELARHDFTITWAIVGADVSRGWPLAIIPPRPCWAPCVLMQWYFRLGSLAICRNAKQGMKWVYWRILSRMRRACRPEAGEASAADGCTEGDIPGPADAVTESERAWVQMIVRHQVFHALIVDRTELLDIFSKGSWHLPIVVLTIDVVWRRCMTYRDQGLKIDFPAMSRDEEVRRLERSDIVVAIQPEEASEFRRMVPQKCVVTVPMPLPMRGFGEICTSLPNCLFVGGPSQHNVDGARWLISAIWPLVLAALPSARLTIAGGVCALLPRNSPGVQLIGCRRDLSPVYGASRICVVPLRFGTGLKVKLVEAMSYGRMVISTPVGIDGYPELADSVVPVAEDAPGFARFIQRGLMDDRWREEMLSKQSAFMKEHFIPKEAVAPLARALETLKEAMP